MRELVVENQEVLIIPSDFKCANKGSVVAVTANDFTLELEKEPKGIMDSAYCEFYTQTSHGKLYFESYPKSIDGNKLVIASPAKHKFLQRRQYTRIKYLNNIELTDNTTIYQVNTLDLSAGGMKFQTAQKIDIDSSYKLKLELSDLIAIECEFQPIRIEKNNEGNYIVSGQFIYSKNADRMMITQYCAKRSVEIRNK